MRHIARWLATMAAIAGPVIFISLVVSPRLAETMSIWGDNVVPVQAHVTSCTPHRDGRHRRTQIVCRFAYAYAGTNYVAQSQDGAATTRF
jgi:hypothetical protein